MKKKSKICRLFPNLKSIWWLILSHCNTFMYKGHDTVTEKTNYPLKKKYVRLDFIFYCRLPPRITCIFAVLLHPFPWCCTEVTRWHVPVLCRQMTDTRFSSVKCSLLKNFIFVGFYSSTQGTWLKHNSAICQTSSIKTGTH